MLLYLEKYDMLADARLILDAVPLLRLQSTPREFKKYFCEQICSEIDSIVQVLSLEEEEALKTGDMWLPSSPFNIESLSMWETLYAENLLPFVLRSLSSSARRKNQSYLVHAVMRHLEPVVESDESIVTLLLQLGWNERDAGAGVYARADWIGTWSVRALQLSAKAMRSPVARGISVTVPCRVRVSDVAKGGRMIVRSRRYSVGSTVCYLSCGREVLPQGDVRYGREDHGKRLGQGLSLYVHLERGSCARERVEVESDARHLIDPADEESNVEVAASDGRAGNVGHDQGDDCDVLRGCSKVKVWVRVMIDDCHCGLVDGDQNNWRGLVKEVYMDFDVNGVVVRGVRHGWDCLLDQHDVESWVGTHEGDCAVTVTGVVEFDR